MSQRLGWCVKSRNWWVVGVLGLWLPSTVWGQAPARNSTGIQIEQFEPMPGQTPNIVNVATSDVLRHMQIDLSLISYFVEGPARLVDVASQDFDQDIVGRQLKAELTGAIGLFDIVDVGLAIPFVLFQSGDGLSELGKSGSVSGVAAGDVRLVPKIRVVDPKRLFGVGVALLAPIYIPTGDTDSFNSDGRVRLEPRVAVDWRHRTGVLLTANLGYQLRPHKWSLNYVSDDLVRWGIGARAPTGMWDVSVFSTIFGSIPTSRGLDTSNFEIEGDSQTGPVELFAGLNKALPFSLTATLGAGVGLNAGVGAPQYRIVAALGHTLGLAEEPEMDSDATDPCLLRSGVPCDQAVEGGEDQDEDGVIGESDECPTEAEDVDGFADADGCPDIDDDADGILDAADACPREAEDVDNYEDVDGCPDPDNDGDGVLDSDDACPNEFGVKIDDPRNNGCAEKPKGLVSVSAETIEINEQIRFQPSSDILLDDSKPILNQLAATLSSHARISLVIAGHTDSSGDDALNLAISQRRAEAVKRYLVEQGVDASRLETAGYGETKPIASNETNRGRAQNRRVDFNIKEVPAAQNSMTPQPGN